MSFDANAIGEGLNTPIRIARNTTSRELQPINLEGAAVVSNRSFPLPKQRERAESLAGIANHGNLVAEAVNLPE